MSARRPITLRPSPAAGLPPRMTPTTPVRPMPVTTSSQPNALSLSATVAAVRCTSYCSSGWACRSCRHAAISACRSDRRLTIGMGALLPFPGQTKDLAERRDLARVQVTPLDHARFATGAGGARLLTRPVGAPTHPAQERVAQLVEHLTFNQVVLGSSPSALTTHRYLYLKKKCAF